MIRDMLIFAGLVLAFGIWAWGRFIFSSPENTFWAAIDSNLRTQSVTREIKQTGPTGAIDEYLQLRLGSIRATHGDTKIVQTNGTKQTLVHTETITTPDTRYTLYKDIQTNEKTKTGKDFDFSEVKNVWGREAITANVPGQSPLAEMLYGVVPFGDLPDDKRRELINFIRLQRVYEVDFAHATKEIYDGKHAYRYTVTITPSAYISMLQKYDTILGLNQIANVNPDDYKGQPDIKAEIVISVTGRQVLEINYPEQARVEKYVSYGALSEIKVPDNAIDESVIQNKVQTILN